MLLLVHSIFWAFMQELPIKLLKHSIFLTNSTKHCSDNQATTEYW